MTDQGTLASTATEKAPATVLHGHSEVTASQLLLGTARYLLRTDVHTFAFSVAANAILSFFPFVVLLMTLIRRVFRSPVMYDVVVDLLRDYLPAGQDFVI